MAAKRKYGRLEHVASPDRPDEMLAPEAHARQHAHVREAHKTELIEDYVELIADLIDAKGEARSVELAQRMGVTQATVGKMIRRLQERGLVTSEPYRSLFLTDAGRRMAEASRRRHIIVLRFLRALGISENAARQDAEGIEHHVSDEALAAMQRFVDEDTGS
jgi:DtxR family manganese transport transcriptional regulator